MGLTLLLFMIFLLIMGFPMMISLVLAPMMIMIIYYPSLSQTFVIQQLIGGTSSFVYLAIPLFIFAADIMCTGIAANRLIEFVGVFVRHIRGGMGIATAAACTLFGAISGSTQATVVAIGRPMRDVLLQKGYSDKDALALIISASGIAILIPPSTGMIMYGVVTGTSVSDLFIAGIGPGLLLFAMFSIYCFFKFKNVKREKRASLKEIFHLTRKAALCLGFPIIIIGGIYTGMFSPTEAAAAAVVYAIFLEVVIYRSIKIQQIPKIALSTGLVTASIFVIIAAGNVFSWLISYARIPQLIISGILGENPSALMVLAVVTVTFFIGCMFVDPFVVIVIATPIFFSTAVKAGINPIHLGTIITLQVAVGGVTPPFGANIFTACAVFNKSYKATIEGIAPYIIMLVAATILVVLIPEISLFLLH